MSDTGKVEINQAAVGLPVKRAWITATVTKPDGTIVEYGVIADSNPEMGPLPEQGANPDGAHS